MEEEEFDEAENARLALRALWTASGQMEGADRLGMEDERGGHTGGTRKVVGENFMALDGEGSGELGFESFRDTNEPTFNRGDAIEKMRSAFKSQLALDGKLREDGVSPAAAAKKAPETSS
jgi:hypothetical protein